MKVTSSIHKRCEYCYLAPRKNSSGKRVIYIYCKRNPKHKQRQG